MSIYKFKKLNETDILLEKVPDDFIDESQYNKEILENGTVKYKI